MDKILHHLELVRPHPGSPSLVGDQQDGLLDPLQMGHHRLQPLRKGARTRRNKRIAAFEGSKKRKVELDMVELNLCHRLSSPLRLQFTGGFHGNCNFEGSVIGIGPKPTKLETQESKLQS